MSSSDEERDSDEVEEEEEMDSDEGHDTRLELAQVLARRHNILEFWQAFDWTELHFAVAEGDLETVKELVEERPELVCKRGAKTETALVVALRMQSGLEMISALVAGRGAEAINLKGEDYLLKCEDSYDPGDKMGWSPLHDAIAYKDPKLRYAVTKLLIESGVKDVDVRDYTVEMTPLMHAADSGYLDVMTLLVEKGADPSAKDGGSNGAIHFAARQKDPACLKYLLSLNPDLANMSSMDDEDSYRQGEFPIHVASQEGSLECVKLLLKMGADATAENSYHKTALDLAKTKEIRELLKAHIATLQQVTPAKIARVSQ